MKGIKQREIVAYGQVSVKQIKERNNQKIELRGVSRGMGKRGRGIQVQKRRLPYLLLSPVLSVNCS